MSKKLADGVTAFLTVLFFLALVKPPRPRVTVYVIRPTENGFTMETARNVPDALRNAATE